MNVPDSTTSPMRSWICGIRRSYCALTSMRGILGTGVESRRASFPYQVQHQEQSSCHDDHVDVVERVMEMLVALAHCPADRGEREAPQGRARDRQERVAPERHPEDPGRNRDEGPHDRGHPPEQHGPIVPAVEPALRPLETLGAEVEEPPVPLSQWPAPVHPDCPAAH